MKRLFINQEGESNKFWSIEIFDNRFTVAFGKVGTKGRESSKEFADADTCVKEAEKLISDKKRNGYKELSDSEEIPEKIEQPYRPMNEEVFWEIIASFNWKRTGDDDAILRPALKRLVSMKIEDIEQFAKILTEKLFKLDGLLYATNIGPDSYKSEDKHFSTDYFLYVRCCVVANGKGYYYHVLNNPIGMPKEMDFEPLLYLADEAYNKKMKTEGGFIETELSFETFSNKEAWQVKV